LTIALSAILILGSIPQGAFAQGDFGGVDKDGSWYVGEGLKQGDYFVYELCHTHYKDCTKFTIEFWVQGDIHDGFENKWLVQTLVDDGAKLLKGTMELGKIAPEPSGGTEKLLPYRTAFKSSIVWLSAFATSYGGEGGEGPKEFRAVSWGKIGNIGGQQVAPTGLETVFTPAGTFDTVLVTWKTGGAESKIWVLDEFPFPVKASTWTHVSSGIPPQEYKFELLDYQENVASNPFSDIMEIDPPPVRDDCQQNYDFVSVKKTTENFQYQMNVKYGPENPQPGCNLEWIIQFLSIYSDVEFLNQVQYDLLVVDDEGTPIRSIAEEDNRNFLYSASGQVRTFMLVTEDPGPTNYVIWIYGLAPEFVVPTEVPDFLEIQITVEGEPIDTPTPTTEIPAWIKNNAGWWADGAISDNDFVQGIQFLINEDIIRIPETTPGQSSGSNEIPAWIKNNAGWWADGAISDNDFVLGIQYLIQVGIMRIG